MNKHTFTLMELMIVIIIIGVLVGMGMPIYQKTIQNAQDKEAKVILRLMADAEEMYQLKYTIYTNCENASNCNDMLKLDLPQINWAYSIPVNSASDFCAQAIGSQGTGNWHINADFDNAATMNCFGG